MGTGVRVRTGDVQSVRSFILAAGVVLYHPAATGDRLKRPREDRSSSLEQKGAHSIGNPCTFLDAILFHDPLRRHTLEAAYLRRWHAQTGRQT
jgi:hypothetical protein